MHCAASFLRASSLTALTLVAVACPVEEPPPARARGVGSIVGQVYLPNEEQELASVGGADVYIYGASARVVSEADKQFVLQSVPVGSHTLVIEHAASGRSRRERVYVVVPYQVVELDAARTTLGSPASLAGTVSVSDGTPAGALVYLVGGSSAQLAVVGDDGSFTLAGLPTGEQSIAATKSGYDVVQLSVSLGEGDNALDEVIALAPATATDLTLTGSVQLAGAIDHRGTAVFLNDGEAVEVTDEQGSYAFAGLSAGVYSLTARHPGFKSVTLGFVALSADGTAGGLVDIFLAPGDDGASSEGQGGDALSIDIKNPLPGSVLTTGVPLTFVAEVENGAVIDDEVVWRLGELGAATAPAELGRGLSIRPDLPPVATKTAFELSVSVERGGVTLAGDVIVVEVDAIVASRVKATAAVGFGILPPVIEQVLDDDGALLRLRYVIQEGQPVLLGNDDELLEAGMAWASDTGQSFTGAADLSVLPVGTHLFTLTVVDARGFTTESELEVRVDPLTFTLAATLPEAAPAEPYFVDIGLPYDVVVTHGFQGVFPDNRIVWRDTTGRQVALGRSGTTFLAIPGAGALTVEVLDAIGNRRTLSQPYTLSEIEFTASFNEPLGGTTVKQGDPLTINLSYAHTFPPAGAPSSLSVELFSDRQIGVVLDDARTSFGIDETVTVSTLVPGVHALTARVHDGTRYASSTTSVRVTSSFVTATKLLPQSTLVLFTDIPAEFEIAVGQSDGVTPLITWYLDGVEFAPSWGGYGTDATASSRARIDLGSYSSTTSPFDDARWSVGPHEVSAFVRLPGVAEAPGCRNLQEQARCLRFPVSVEQDATPTLDMTIADGEAVVWSGTVLLSGDVNVLGTLIIQPGTNVLVDVRTPGNPTEPVYYAYRRIQVNESGTLQVGTEGVVEPVVMQVIGSLAAPGRWQGIVIGSDAAVVDVSNAVIRHAAVAIDAGNVTTPSVRLHDVTVEDSDNGVSHPCPTDVAGLTARRVGGWGFTVGSNHYACEEPVIALGGFTFEDVGTGIALGSSASGKTYLVDDLAVTRASSYGIALASYWGADATNTLVIRDATVAESTVGVRADDGDSRYWSLYVTGSAFTANTEAIAIGYGQTEAEIVGNAFTRNDTAISVAGYQTGGALAREVHLNTFDDNTRPFVITGSGDVVAHGNWLGSPSDPSDPAYAIALTPSGRTPNIAAVSDGVDDGMSGVARVDNPIGWRWDSAATAPVAYVREPEHTSSYRGDRCVPLRAEAPLTGIDTSADCRWTLYVPGTSPAVTGTSVAPDADGCLDATVDEGEHALLLACDERDDAGLVVRTSEVTSRFLVDSGAWRGPLRATSESWSGTVFLDGDVIVPAGTTLTIAAGTSVQLASVDRARHSRVGASGRLGSPSLVDIFVDGTLLVQGTSGSRVSFAPESGLSDYALWGSIVVGDGAVVDVASADFHAGDFVFQGDYDASRPLSAPDIRIRGSSFERVTGVVAGVCPRELTSSTVDDAQVVISDDGGYGAARCPADVVLDSLLLTDLAHAVWSYWIAMQAYDGLPLPPTATVRDVVIEGRGGYTTMGALSVLSGFEDVLIDGVDISSAQQGITLGSPGTIVGATVDSVSYGIDTAATARLTAVEISNASRGINASAPTIIEDSAITFATQGIAVNAPTQVTGTLIDGGVDGQEWGVSTSNGTLVMTGSRITRYQTAYVHSYAATTRIEACVIENVAIAVQADYLEGSSADLILWGNNFLPGITTVLSVDSDPRANGVDVDMTGSYFGVTTDAEIEALIDDNRPDASPIDQVRGDTDYSGYVTAPLALTTP